MSSREPITSQPAGAIIISKLPGIFSHHLKMLRDRGLCDEIIKAAGIHSEHDKIRLASILDTKRCPFKSAALVIPYTGINGQNGYARVRPDTPRLSKKKPVKYESPVGRRNQIYFPPGVAELVAEIGQDIVITEGEFKALASTQHGFACIGLVGVYGWAMPKHEALLPELERIGWQGRKVYIAFDSDITEKPDVQDAECALHRTSRTGRSRQSDSHPLRPAGYQRQANEARPRRLSRYPRRSQASDEGAGSTRPRTRRRRRPLKFGVGPAKLTPRGEGPEFIDAEKLDGVSRLRFWRGSWYYWSRGAYREHQPAEVRARLVKKLMQDFFAIAQAHTSNVLDVAKAVAIIPSSVEPPAWIGKSGQWPADELLAAKNGIIHLPSLASGLDEYTCPLTPRLFTQNALGYAFDFDAPRPTAWFGFLDKLWASDPDSIALLQEWFGYSLTADTRQQKIMMIVGPKRSGKGTIARVLRETVGSANCCGPTLASLGTNFGLWPLLGKSLGIISDARLGGRTDSQVVVERLLSISGEDALTIDRKNLEPVTCKLPTRIMILSNELPRLGDSSGALAGRIILLRLRESFYGREDHDLTDKLLSELPGILLWAIDGWCRLRHRGRFVQPPSAADLLGELHDISSPIGEFIRECCVIGPACRVARSDLYERYKEWCNGKGRNHYEDQTGFGRSLRAAIPTLGDSQPRVDGQKTRFYEGIGLA